MDKEYQISTETFIYDAYYGISSMPTKWPAHKVVLFDLPDKDVLTYKSRSGWIVVDRDTGKVYHERKAGVSGYGFNTAELAVDNYIIKYNEEW
ncbi:MAG: hypothetical protein WCY09_08960 [Candidatus Omnitrophota bacterium]|jgi:hypothetical protein